MIQRFSLWKTIVVIVSLVLGTLYGLPNGFPDDPAVQITSNRSTEILGELDVIRAEDALKDAGIKPIARDFEDSQALIRFDSVETQIKAKGVIQAALGSDFIVALNLAPTTPEWLQSIGANPMKLGLDLRGGVHFLMEVDLEAAVSQRLDAYASEIKQMLRQERIRFRSVDVLMIDDVQFINGKESTQEEFFHTFNELYEAQRQIFLTSDRPAGEIDKIESRLLSRFQWGLVTDIQAPDWETRVAILTKKAQAMGISIEPEVLEFLAKNISRNVRRMEGALTRVAGYVGLTRKKADLETIQRLLRDILREENLSRITIETIQKKVVDYYHLRMADMLSRRRPANIAFPRQVAMYLSRILTEHSLQEIGAAFGGRDHGTVIHACKTVENMMDQDTSIKTAVELLNEQLSQSMS